MTQDTELAHKGPAGIYHYWTHWHRFWEVGHRELSVHFGNPEAQPYSVLVIHNFRSPLLGLHQEGEPAVKQWWPATSVGMFREGSDLIPLEEGMVVPIGRVHTVSFHLTSKLFEDYIESGQEGQGVDSDNALNGFLYVIIAPTHLIPSFLGPQRRGQQWHIAFNVVDDFNYFKPIFDYPLNRGWCLQDMKNTPRYRVLEIDRIQGWYEIIAADSEGHRITATPRVYLQAKSSGGNVFTIWERAVRTLMTSPANELITFIENIDVRFDPALKMVYTLAEEVAQIGLGFPYVRLTATGGDSNRLRLYISGRFEHYGEIIPDPYPDPKN